MNALPRNVRASARMPALRKRQPCELSLAALRCGQQRLPIAEGAKRRGDGTCVASASATPRLAIAPSRARSQLGEDERARAVTRRIRRLHRLFPGAIGGLRGVGGLSSSSGPDRLAELELFADLALRQDHPGAREVHDDLGVFLLAQLLHVQVEAGRDAACSASDCERGTRRRGRGESTCRCGELARGEVVLLRRVHLAERERARAAGVARERAAGEALGDLAFASLVIPECR
jgi:hypothetical protein